MPRAPRTEYAEERLEGKAFEEAFEYASEHAASAPTTIRMQRDDGAWENVGPGGDREDGRVPAVIAHMHRVQERAAACLGTLGWSVVSAVFLVTDADGNLQNLDLQLRAGPAAGELDGREALVELTWSQGTPAKASKAGERKLAKYWGAQARVPRRDRLVGTLGVAESRFHFTLAQVAGRSYFWNVRHLHNSGPQQCGADKRARGIGAEAENQWRAANADKCRGYVDKCRADAQKEKKKDKAKKKKKGAQKKAKAQKTGKTRKQVKKR